VALYRPSLYCVFKKLLTQSLTLAVREPREAHSTAAAAALLRHAQLSQLMRYAKNHVFANY